VRHALTGAAALAAVLLTLAGNASAASSPEPRLTESEVVRAFLAYPKVERWLERYPPGPTTDASFDEDEGSWTVHVWSGDAGEIARGVVVDADRSVTEAWTGPQVA
jgi:hypothetical protein